MASERVVARLGHGEGGHTGAVRDVHHHPSSHVVTTASYDHSIKIWRPEAEVASSDDASSGQVVGPDGGAVARGGC